MFHRLILAQVVLYLIADIIAFSNKMINPQIFNAYMLVEAVLVIWAFFWDAKNQVVQRLYLGLLGLFGIVFAIDLATMNGFFLHAAIAEGMILTVVTLHWLQNHFFTGGEGQKGGSPLAIGLLLYFACTIPYLSIMLFLQKSDASVNRTLFQNIVLVAAHARYILVAIGFFRCTMVSDTQKMS